MAADPGFGGFARNPDQRPQALLFRQPGAGRGKGEDKLSSWAIGSVMALAFGIGILFFVVLPHYLTGFLGDFFASSP
jgi:hypothetical protein